MDFFHIKPTTEKKIVGPSYPQIQTSGGHVSKFGSDSIYEVYSDSMPDFVPNLNFLVLEPNAIMTDILSASMISPGFLVNDKVKTILERYKLPDHKFFPATIKHRQELYTNYYWFFFISDILHYIDYSITKFFMTDLLGNKLDECENITSANDLINLKDVTIEQRDVDAYPVYMNEKIIDVFDLFKLKFGNYQTYVSQDLAKELDEHTTGLNITLSKKVLVSSNLNT